MLVLAAECWLGSWQGPTLFDAATGSPVHDGIPELRIPGTVFGGFVDAHVHLGLIDGARLLSGGIAAVHDLGWIPDVASRWPHTPGLPSVRYAGAFLTAPGGYPADRCWAPPGSVVEVASPERAADAVSVQLAAGASFVKLALNSVAGPVFDDDTLRALVSAAHGRGVTVVAHAEGAGQAARAFEAGVDRLAHAPFTEPIAEELLAAMVDCLSWVSTLNIHDGPAEVIALDNVRRFAALGGEVRYGTDLGNGAQPDGVNPSELAALAEAGVDPVAAIAPAALGERLCWAAGSPTDHASVAEWLATASVINATDLEETFS
jgi:hypothetical protein